LVKGGRRFCGFLSLKIDSRIVVHNREQQQGNIHNKEQQQGNIHKEQPQGTAARNNNKEPTARNNRVYLIV
jgi:hypothetical protein